MYKKLICVLTFISSEICFCNVSIPENTELVLAFMTHRHGDRTPVKDTIPFATDPARVVERTLRYGFGQLTDRGRIRSYKLGKFIRRRYDSLLSAQYNSSEIYIRSTDYPRTEMTVLTAMAAVYPPGKDSWSQDINWTPVPYTTVRQKYDSMLAIENCPVVVKAYERKIQEPIPAMAKYKYLLKELSGILGINISRLPTSLYFINDMFISQKPLGVPLTPFLENTLPEIEEGAGQVMNVLFGDEKYLALHAGVLLKDFFDAVERIIIGKDVPRVQVYSGHDINVFTLSAVSKITPRLGVPKYGSLFCLELRRNVETGQYIVIPVYLEQPGVEEVHLQVDGCEGFCDLDRFRELTSKYVRNETQWRIECEFSEDFDIDTD